MKRMEGAAASSVSSELSKGSDPSHPKFFIFARNLRCLLLRRALVVASIWHPHSQISSGTMFEQQFYVYARIVCVFEIASSY
jgi:hypothetical protein